MSFRKDGKELSSIIYGWGTATTYNNFATTEVNANIKTSDTAMRAVSKNSNFMPFSDEVVTGFSKSGSNILTASAFAGVNRFILSNTGRVTRTDTSLTAIYYKGNGYNALGDLYVGGTATSNRISTACPPVIMIAIQAAGGNGSSGLARGNAYIAGINVWQHIGGNGAGSGAFACFQLKLPHDATTPTLVGYYQVSTANVTLRDKDNVTFATVNKGGDGGGVSGTNDLWDGQYSHSQGSAGTGGSVSILSLTSRPEWYNANRTTTAGTSTSSITGADGGKGGYNDGGGTSSVSGRYGASNASGKSTTVYINNSSSGNSFTGKSGGTASGNGNGGAGAGSMFGTGANGNTAAGTSEYGAGGGGGTPTKTSWAWFTGGNDWVDGKSGAGGCVRFYW